MSERPPVSARDPITDIVHGVPPVAVSTTSTRANRTGSWKNIRPIYQDKVAPCNQGCPVGIDIEAHMNLVREGRLTEAVELLLRENPLPAVTGRVCPHPCESACNRAQLDEAVSIHAVERLLGDLALDAPAAPASAPRRTETVGVVGSGPAGLSCAYHLARLGYGVTVYEADAEPGGALRHGIPEYRLPKRVVDGEVDRIRALGVRFRCATRVGKDVSFAEVCRHDAVFVAAGAGVARALAAEGTELTGVRFGLDFLREIGAGRRPKVGRHVLVAGGDSTAVDCARAALRLGAQVLVVCAESRERALAGAGEIEDAMREGVRFEFQAAPVRLLPAEDVPEVSPLDAVESSFGEEGDGPCRGCVARVECVRLAEVAGGDGVGAAPAPPTERFTARADAVLVAQGADPDLGFLPPEVARGGGLVETGALGGTGLAAVFAGGDLLDQPRTVAHAIGAGKRAAIGIDRHLRLRAGQAPEERELAGLRYGPAGNVSLTRWRGDDPVRRAGAVNEVVSYRQLNVAHFVHTPRWPDRLRPAAECRGDFTETNLGLARADGLAEAGRCLNCGVCNSCELCLIFCPDAAITRRAAGGFQISYKYCKGCGVCAAECPRCAMAMTREGL
jgi:NADPH-dependent glutamate synthase beta subunit-like oxidoreductase